MKYNLHYGDVRGDVVPPPHGIYASFLETKTHYGLEKGEPRPY